VNNITENVESDSQTTITNY